ncbi:MAG: hypothetical protein AB1758_12105 [Candidatus Eremiobacterota bacterium]
MRRGFTLVEAILAFFLLVVAFLVLFSIFSGGARHAVQSRNRTVAMVYAQSFLEEVRAHPYGQPEPEAWKQARVYPVAVYVEGRPQTMEFNQEVTYRNESFVKSSVDQDVDEVTLRLTWREGLGDNAHEKELLVKTAVWR